MEPSFTYKFYKTTVEAWDAMSEAMLSAKKSIYWEIYIFVDDSIGNRFVNLLADKARSGVEVKIIIDAFGSAEFSKESEKILQDSGAEIHKFNRIQPVWKFEKWFNSLMYRNHRKVLIIDEEKVFLGGVNVQAKFQTWDDLYLMITGKAARPLLRAFAKSYISAGGKRVKVKHLLRPRMGFFFPEFVQKIRFIAHSPTDAKMPKMKSMYLAALKTAKESVNLVTPYYVPDRHFLRAIALAKKRGVKVNIFMPQRPDILIMELIGRTYFELSTRLGANIYLLPNMNHAKAMTIDDKMGVVGSVNITPRSFTHNEESVVTFTDEQMVNELNSMFNDLRTKAELFDVEKWKKRGWRDKLSEWLAKKIEYFV